MKHWRAPQRGIVLDADWRHHRARKGGHAAREAHAKQRQERGERYQTKGDAYVAGYAQGYRTAMAWWARKYARDIKRGA